MMSNELLRFDSIEAAKESLREMRASDLSADERLQAHALANAIQQAILRLYFDATEREVVTG